MVFIFQNTQKHPDVQPKKPRISYMLPSMEQNDAVLEKQSGLEVVWKVDNSISSACFLTFFYFYHQKNELASTTLKSPALAASNQSLFKAEKMTEPLKPPA